MTLNPAAAPGHVTMTRDIAAISMDFTAVEDIEVQMLGGTDTFTGGAGVAGRVDNVVVHGGTGVDTLTGGDEPDTLDGGQTAGDVLNGGGGDDTLLGGADGDQLNGGAGNDRFPVSATDAGADAIDGGDGLLDALVLTGRDTSERFAVTGTPGNWAVSVPEFAAQIATSTEVLRLLALGGNDSLAVDPGALDALTLDVDGGAGDDTISATNGPDVLRGGDDDDILSGGAGNDQLFGDAGTDRLTGAAGADAFHCGGVGDALDATAEDSVDADCLPPPAAPAPAPATTTPTTTTTPEPVVDRTAPKFTLRGFPKRIARGSFLRTGLRGDVVLSEAARLEIALVGRLKGAKIAAVGEVVLAEAKRGLAGGTRRGIRLRLSKALARRLTHHPQLALRVTAIDAAGNRATRTRRISVH
jgi:Ca2+-binding RTX toxin-like protein